MKKTICLLSSIIICILMASCGKTVENGEKNLEKTIKVEAKTDETKNKQYDESSSEINEPQEVLEKTDDSNAKERSQNTALNTSVQGDHGNSDVTTENSESNQPSVQTEISVPTKKKCLACPDECPDDEAYCSKHRCRKCHNVRAGKSTSLCVDHKCLICNDAKYSSYVTGMDPTAVYSDYCKNHMCDKTGCKEVVVNGKSFCVEHGCVLCDREVASPATDYCTSHKCRNCRDVVVENSAYCLKHKCLLCDKGVYGNEKYCYKHKQ